MRTTSDFWVTAYIRQRNAKHKPTVLIKRGAEQAGAIFLQIDRLDGSYDLYEPASQLDYQQSDIDKGLRLFTRALENVAVFDVMDRMEAEAKFDPDYWLVETECADASHDLDEPSQTIQG